MSIPTWSASTSARSSASRDNFAALNSAVFSDGSFCFIPAGVRCPMELSTYFRINAAQTGQFERTLIVAEEGASVSYLEGCTAPMRDEHQLHAAVVELVAFDDASIKYSTVQNWYPGDADGNGGIYNFVTKRGRCAGARSKISWTQVETGSAITWKYPSVVLQGDDSVGEFYSVAVTTNRQQADTGTKMIHIGRNTRSTIVSKGISAGRAHNTYRGLVKGPPVRQQVPATTRCDYIGDRPGVRRPPLPLHRGQERHRPGGAQEQSTSKISEDQLFYCRQRGTTEEKMRRPLIVNGFAGEVFDELPMEYAVEAQALNAHRGQPSKRAIRLSLRISNLKPASAGGRPILDRLDPEVPIGEVHAIIGATNGVGEEHALNVLSGRTATSSPARPPSTGPTCWRSPPRTGPPWACSRRSSTRWRSPAWATCTSCAPP